MKQIFIGDVHGKFGRYKTLIKQYQNTIQLGDMGVGFYKYTMNQDIKADANPPHYKMIEGGHRFIRGNHDNPSVCRQQSQYISDGHTENGMMFIGSASSVDIDKRTKHMDWWPDEELSQKELDILTEQYLDYKPIVMATHDCPESIAKTMRRYEQKITGSNRIRLAFQNMFEHYQPKIWIFGHWHQSYDRLSHGTRFICLNELEIKELEF